MNPLWHGIAPSPIAWNALPRLVPPCHLFALMRVEKPEVPQKPILTAAEQVRAIAEGRV